MSSGSANHLSETNHTSMENNFVTGYLVSLQLEFEQHADAAKASFAKAYMRNLSDFYGIKAQERATLIKTFFKQNHFPSIDQLESVIAFCWDKPQREWQYFAMELVAHYAKTKNPQYAETLIEQTSYMITHKSWWDCVDFIAVHIVGEVFARHTSLLYKYIDTWMNSGNTWLRRSCLLFQLKYKKHTDYDLLFDLCTRLANEKDFFIRKSIGWVLREYSKSDPEKVLDYVEHQTLSNLSRKEALRIIKKNQQKKNLL
jgi:3-methyladenine DNA glycosylase AlkD